MEALFQKIENLELKLTRLLDKTTLLQQENDQLKSQLSILQKNEKEIKINNEELGKVKQVDSQHNIHTNNSLDQVKGELDSYISEIDECIKLLKAS